LKTLEFPCQCGLRAINGHAVHTEAQQPKELVAQICAVSVTQRLVDVHWLYLRFKRTSWL